MDPYEVLGIPRDASIEEVKKAYRVLSKKYHPDVHANNPLAELAAKKFAEINDAYRTILEHKSGSASSSNKPVDDTAETMEQILAHIEWREYNAAIAKINKLLYNTPNNHDLLVLRAKCYSELEDFQSAAKDIRIPADALTDNVEIQTFAGVVFTDIENYSTAERYLRNANKLRPESPDIMMFLAIVLARQGKFEEADILRHRVSIQDPNNKILNESENIFDKGARYVRELNRNKAVKDIEYQKEGKIKNPKRAGSIGGGVIILIFGLLFSWTGVGVFFAICGVIMIIQGVFEQKWVDATTESKNENNSKRDTGYGANRSANQRSGASQRTVYGHSPESNTENNVKRDTRYGENASAKPQSSGPETTVSDTSTKLHKESDSTLFPIIIVLLFLVLSIIAILASL